MKHRILFVCLGNICRSPMAEAIMKKLVEERGLSNGYVIDSAAVGPWHIGQLPDVRMRRHAARHGYDMCSRARQFSSSDFDNFDYIVVMDEDNRKAILRQARTLADETKVSFMASYLRHHPGQATVPDPYYGGEKGFELVIELLEDACLGLFEEIQKGTSAR